MHLSLHKKQISLKYLWFHDWIVVRHERRCRLPILSFLPSLYCSMLNADGRYIGRMTVCICEKVCSYSNGSACIATWCAGNVLYKALALFL